MKQNWVRELIPFFDEPTPEEAGTALDEGRAGWTMFYGSPPRVTLVLSQDMAIRWFGISAADDSGCERFDSGFSEIRIDAGRDPSVEVEGAVLVIVLEGEPGGQRTV